MTAPHLVEPWENRALRVSCRDFGQIVAEVSMLQTVLLLFIVLDPFGNLVMINSLLKDYTPSQRRRIMMP